MALIHHQQRFGNAASPYLPPASPSGTTVGEMKVDRVTAKVAQLWPGRCPPNLARGSGKRGGGEGEEGEGVRGEGLSVER